MEPSLKPQITPQKTEAVLGALLMFFVSTGSRLQVFQGLRGVRLDRSMSRILRTWLGGKGSLEWFSKARRLNNVDPGLINPFINMGCSPPK